MHAPRISCRRAAPRLTAYLTGGMSAEDAAAIRRHLEECEACRASAKSLADTLDLLRDALAASSATQTVFEPARVERLRAATRRPAASPARPFWLAPAWAAAAALVVTVAAALVWPILKDRSTRGELLGAAAKARSIMQAMDPSWNCEMVYLRPADKPQKAQPPATVIRGLLADGNGKFEEAKKEASKIAAPASPPALADNRRGGESYDQHALKQNASGTAGGDLTYRYEGSTTISGGRLEMETLARSGNGSLTLASPGSSGGGGTGVNDGVLAPSREKSDLAGALDGDRRAGNQDSRVVSGQYAARSASGRRDDLSEAREAGAVVQDGKAMAGVDLADRAPADQSRRDSGRASALDDIKKPSPAHAENKPQEFAQNLQAEESPASGSGIPLLGDIPTIGALSNAGAKMPAEPPTESSVVATPAPARPPVSPTSTFTITASVELAKQLRELDSNSLKALLEAHGAQFEGGESLAFQDEYGRLVLEKSSSRVAENVERAVKDLAPAEVEFNAYIPTVTNAVSTFSIDVDTASYALARRELLAGRRPRPDQVRTEEIVNALDYAYRSPPAGEDFAVETQLAASPFRPGQTVLQIGVTARRVGRDRRRPAALTAVLDLSGSMNTPDRLGRARRALTLLVDALEPDDTLALVVFGSDARLALEPTPASDAGRIRAALDMLATSGSTHLENGLRLGYTTAARYFRAGASNRVLLFSDGVANLGADTAAELLAGVAQERARGVCLSVFGVGAGSYNDALLEQLADRGDGAYTLLDSDAAARRALVDDLTATLQVVARDVKIQVEFDPARVGRWRQLGYENRRMTRAQFRDDRADAGEVGSGQSVTALYELDGVTAPPPGAPASGAVLATVRLRWRDEGGRIRETETRVAAPATPPDFAFAPATTRIAVCAAEFAERLRGSPYSAGLDPRGVVAALQSAALELGRDARVTEFAELVRRAADLQP